MDGQGSDPAVRNGRAHRLRPGRQHLATACPSSHWIHLARRGSRTDLTGAEVLVWDGSNIDDTSGKWIDGGWAPPTTRRLTAGGSCPGRRSATGPGQSRPGRQPAAGHRRILWRCEIRCEDGAAYDPAANTWTPIPALAGGAIAPEAASAWTGSELIIWSATTSKEGRSTSNAASAYNPRTKRWRTLPPAPITPRRLAALVWAGDRLLVWGGIQNVGADKLAYPGRRRRLRPAQQPMAAAGQGTGPRPRDAADRLDRRTGRSLSAA